MSIEIPEYLMSTVKMIECSYPNGIGKQYYPLLAVLYEELSDRNLALIISYLIQKPHEEVLNDIYSVKSKGVSNSEKQLVINKLSSFGYIEWLRDNE